MPFDKGLPFFGRKNFHDTLRVMEVTTRFFPYFGAVLLEGNIGFYGKCGFDYARNFGIRYHDLPEGSEDSFCSFDL